MKITSNISDYPQADVSITATVDPRKKNVKQSMGLTLTNPVMLTAGVQKLIQRYVIYLFTEKGSQASFPDFGTEFMTDVRKGIQTLDAFMHAFNFANMEAITAIRKEQSSRSDLPDSEILDTVLLTDIALVRETATVSFTVKMLTAAGDDTEFVLPFNLN